MPARIAQSSAPPSFPSRPAAPAPAIPPLLLDDVQSAAFLGGISVRKFHELRDEPWFPKPVVLGPRLLRWSRPELEAAVASMPRQAERSEPAELARSRIQRMKGGAK